MVVVHHSSVHGRRGIETFPRRSRRALGAGVSVRPVTRGAQRGAVRPCRRAPFSPRQPVHTQHLPLRPRPPFHPYSINNSTYGLQQIDRTDQIRWKTCACIALFISAKVTSQVQPCVLAGSRGGGGIATEDCYYPNKMFTVRDIHRKTRRSLGLGGPCVTKHCQRREKCMALIEGQ